MVQQPHPPFPAQPSPVGLMAAVTGPPGSNATAGEPIGTSVLPSRVQANLNSIEEAGVGPMAPLIEDDNSRLSTNSSTDDPVSYFLLFFFFSFRWLASMRMTCLFPSGTWWRGNGNSP